MKKIYQSLVVAALIALMMSLGAGPVQAEERTLTILAPWQAEGRIFRIDQERLKFLGALEGVMYIENGQGELNAAIFDSPVVMEINPGEGISSATGDFLITTSAGDDVFAKWTCTGAPGGCLGDFIITGGTGGMEGVTGQGKMIIRTALASTAINLKSGSVIREAIGLAIWPELKINVPQ